MGGEEGGTGDINSDCETNTHKKSCHMTSILKEGGERGEETFRKGRP